MNFLLFFYNSFLFYFEITSYNKISEKQYAKIDILYLFVFFHHFQRLSPLSLSFRIITCQLTGYK